MEQPPAAVELTEYPTYGEIDCEGNTFNGLPYTGSVQRISATDASTVVFELCGPDPAFLSKIAFSAFAIHDTDYLLNHAADKSIVTEPNGTGPYRLVEFRQGEQVIFEAFPDYWGEQPVAADAVLRWSSEAGQKFVELTSGAVDGIDNVQPDDIEAIQGDPNLNLIDREGFNVFYIGMNRDEPPFNNVKVRQAIALGIDRQGLIDQFFAPGSTVADYFTPCIIPFACDGTAFPAFNLPEAQRLLAEGLAEESMDSLTTTLNYRVVDRAYLPLPDQVALAIVDQLEQNLGITATPEEQESGTFIDNANNGRLRGLHLLGWTGDYPDTSNFLDNHFGPGTTIQFGQIYDDIADALTRAGSTSVEAERLAAYEEANTLLATHFPMLPVAHAGSATAWRADVEGAHSSPLGNEALFAVSGGADDQVVFMQSGPPLGLYCADETDGESLRACEQISEALYKFEVGGFDAEPGLATGCEANEDLSVWTCTLREGVTFHDGAALDAGDVVMSYAVQWDNLHPLHVGRAGNFAYWGGTWGGYLNPDAPCGISGQPACED
ncbi:MAG: ABC transporter substrate-binding protein [Candidatus Limnocylindrales bacterium]